MFSDVDRALADLSAGEPPPDVVILHLRVAERRQLQALADLRRAAPLVRIVLCGGPWCYRRLHRWLACGIDRIFSENDLLVGLPRYLEELAELRAPLPPLTASADERLAWEVDACRGLPGRKQAIGVVADSRDSRLLWADLCQAHHYQVSVHRELNQCVPAESSVILWETHQWDARAENDLREFRQQRPDPPVVVLLGLARQDDLTSAHAAGANVCLEKPFLIADLLWLIDLLCRSDTASAAGLGAPKVARISQAEREFLLTPAPGSDFAA